jgi:hypothetical protein
MLTETIWRIERTTFAAAVKGGMGETSETVLTAAIVQSNALSRVTWLMFLVTLTAMEDTE